MDRPTSTTVTSNDWTTYPDFDEYDDEAFSPLLRTTFGAASSAAIELNKELPPLLENPRSDRRAALSTKATSNKLTASASLANTPNRKVSRVRK